jgi:hypothetical protein
MIDSLVIAGTALRGAFARATSELAAGIRVPQEPLTLRDVADRVLGTAEVCDSAEGDLFVEAHVDPACAPCLINAPYLSVAALLDADDGPATVGHILISLSATDPFQLPYRITRVPADLAGHGLLHDYHRVRVVDQVHDVEIALRADGQMDVVFDEGKSHFEWRHRKEVCRQGLPGAIAEGFGFGSWGDLETAGDVSTARAILSRVARLL